MTAVDPSPRLLGVVKTAAQQQGLSIVSEVGGASNLPVSDGSSDCVLSNFGIIFAPDPGAAVTEIAGLLSPRGRPAVRSGRWPSRRRTW